MSDDEHVIEETEDEDEESDPNFDESILVRRKKVGLISFKGLHHLLKRMRTVFSLNVEPEKTSHTT